MTDPIKALIAAAQNAVAVYNGNGTHREERVAIDALEAALSIAAEARPEPAPPSLLDLHGLGRDVAPHVEPAAEPSDKVAIYLQAAADCRMNKTTDDWQELSMMYLSDAVEALAREVRK